MRVEIRQWSNLADWVASGRGRLAPRSSYLSREAPSLRKLPKRGMGTSNRWRRRMAGVHKPEFPPLLPHGFHQYSLETLRALCVDQFNGSLTRVAIMDGLERVIARLNSTGLKMDVWVNGSFLTQKLNPDDVDFAARIEEAEWRAADANQKSAVRWLNVTDLKPDHRCDAYAFVEFDQNSVAVSGGWEWDRAYWLRQFGFSRSDGKKGLAVLKLPFIIR